MLAPRPTKLRSQRDINLWRIPLQLSLVAVALFGITLIPDILDKYGVIHIPSWLTMGSIDDARAILSAMMGAVATVLALIFSVALLVLSMVATLFGPRLLYRFLQDWITQATLGVFMGTFIYLCLVFLVTHQRPRALPARMHKDVVRRRARERTRTFRGLAKRCEQRLRVFRQSGYFCSLGGRHST